MVIASSVFSVRAEETLVVETLESHSEVIGFCIQRIAGWVSSYFRVMEFTLAI